MKNEKKEVKVNYTPYKKNNKGDLIKSYQFTQMITRLEILDVSNTAKNIISTLITNQTIPIRNKPKRKFYNKMIYNYLNVDDKTFNNAINELKNKKYLQITDNKYIINVHIIEQAITKIFNTRKNYLIDNKANEMVEKTKEDIDRIKKMIEYQKEIIEFRKFQNKEYDDIQSEISKLENEIQEKEAELEEHKKDAGITSNKADLEPFEPETDNTPEEQKEEAEQAENEQLEQQFNYTSNNSIIQTVDNNNDITSNKADLEPLEPIRDNNLEQEEKEPEQAENNNNTIKINDEIMGEKLERKEAIDFLMEQHCSKVYNKAALNDIRDLINRMLDYKLNNDDENVNLTRKEINRLIKKYEDIKFEDKTKDNEYANQLVNNVSNISSKTMNNNNEQSGTTETNNNISYNEDELYQLLEQVKDDIMHETIRRQIEELKDAKDKQKKLRYINKLFDESLNNDSDNNDDVTNHHDDLNNDSDNNNDDSNNDKPNDDDLDKGIDFEDLDMI
ncbi:MAG: hypothetical protein ACOCVF_03360 [bacterium]